MRKGKIGLVGAMAVVLALVFAGQGFAAEWPQVLEQVKAKYAKYTDDIKDLNMTQEMTTVSPEGNMVAQMTMLQKGKKFRSDSTMNMPGAPAEMGPMKTTIIFDGKDTWMISSMMGKKKLPQKEGQEYQKDKNWWDFISEKAKITGTEKVGGRECYVVEMEPQKDSAFTKLWLDMKNFVPMKMESKANKKDVMVMEFSELKKIKGGWEMPYKTTMFMNGKLVSTIVVKSLDVNKGVADDQFDAAKVPVDKKGFSMGNMMKEMMK